MPSLRIPAVLTVTVIAGAVAAATTSCGTGTPVSDAGSCSVVCVAQGTGGSNCLPTTCATGSNHDMCPPGCIPEPIV